MQCFAVCRPEQAVYGRLEGMYTKSQLMESLAEQKEHTLRLVDKVDELAGGLGDMEVTTRYDRVIRLSKSECALRGALREVRMVQTRTQPSSSFSQCFSSL